MNQGELNQNLINAAEKGDIDKVRTLLPKPSTCGFTQGADVHAHNDSALRWAANKSHTEIVQVLLQADADVHAKNDEALWRAAHEGHTTTVQVLLQADADVHARNDYALRHAAYSGNTETVQAMLQAGANSTHLKFPYLKKFLTPKFILSLGEELMTAMETSHPELRQQYEYS